MGTSAHLGGAKQTRGGEAATNPDEKSVGVSKPLTRAPRVHPRPRPVRAGRHEDGAPSTSGVVVTLLPGGKIVIFAALAISTPSATTRWDLDPAAKWLAAETEAVAGAAPPARESPRCARSRRRPRRWPPRPPARTPPAWSAASSCTALRRVRRDERRARVAPPGYGRRRRGPLASASRLGVDPRGARRELSLPPARSHACAFATPPPFAGSEAARDAYETGASVRTDVYVLGGYAGRVGRRDDDGVFEKRRRVA